MGPSSRVSLIRLAAIAAMAYGNMRPKPRLFPVLVWFTHHRRWLLRRRSNGENRETDLFRRFFALCPRHSEAFLLGPRVAGCKREGQRYNPAEGASCPPTLKGLLLASSEWIPANALAVPAHKLGPHRLAHRPLGARRLKLTSLSSRMFWDERAWAKVLVTTFHLYTLPD